MFCVISLIGTCICNIFSHSYMHMLYLQFYFQISILYMIHNYYSSHDNLSTGMWTPNDILSPKNNRICPSHFCNRSVEGNQGTTLDYS